MAWPDHVFEDARVCGESNRIVSGVQLYFVKRLNTGAGEKKII
jgi:hypothetical protein